MFNVTLDLDPLETEINLFRTILGFFLYLNTDSALEDCTAGFHCRIVLEDYTAKCKQPMSDVFLVYAVYTKHTNGRLYVLSDKKKKIYIYKCK